MAVLTCGPLEPSTTRSQATMGALPRACRSCPGRVAGDLRRPLYSASSPPFSTSCRPAASHQRPARSRCEAVGPRAPPDALCPRTPAATHTAQRNCTQGRCGRCPPGSGVMSDLIFSSTRSARSGFICASVAAPKCGSVVLLPGCCCLRLILTCTFPPRCAGALWLMPAWAWRDAQVFSSSVLYSAAQPV